MFFFVLHVIVDRLSQSHTMIEEEMGGMERIFDLEEFMAMANIKRSLAYKMMQQGTVRAVKCGRLWRIPESGISEWLRGGVAGGTDKHATE